MTIGVADDYQSVCLREYKKDPKLKPEDIQLILDWLKKQAHLPKLEGNEFINIFFLTVYRFSL